MKKPRKVWKLFWKGRVLVEGVNIITKHTKPTSQNTKGGIVKKEAPIAISNVMLWDAKTGAPTKVKRSRENGKLVRIKKIRGGNQIMSTTSSTPRLADKYTKEVVPALMKKFSYKTVMQAPKAYQDLFESWC